MAAFHKSSSEFKSGKCKDGDFCPGLGAKASTFWLAQFFLKPFFGHDADKPGLQRLIERCLDWKEKYRPEPMEVVSFLRHLLNETNVAG